MSEESRNLNCSNALNNFVQQDKYSAEMKNSTTDDDSEFNFSKAVKNPYADKLRTCRKEPVALDEMSKIKYDLMMKNGLEQAKSNEGRDADSVLKDVRTHLVK